MSPWEPPPRERSPANPRCDTKPPPRATISPRTASGAAEARRQDAAAKAGRRPPGGRSASRRMRPCSGGDALDSAMGEGEAGGAANAASRGAARGRGASRCRMRRGAPFPLMSPPQKSASRASRCLKTAGGQDARPPLFVFAARRKPPPTSWSRAARAGGHSRPLSGGVLEGPGLSLRSATVRCAAATGFSNDRSSSHFHFRSKQRNVGMSTRTIRGSCWVADRLRARPHGNPAVWLPLCWAIYVNAGRKVQRGAG